MKYRKLWLFTALSGFLAVALGAFGAHGLADKLDAHQMTIWNKAVSYQFYHSLAALIALGLQASLPSFKGHRSALFFLWGILFFSGSLYLLACKELLAWENTAWLGPLTPAGGLLFLSGWAYFFLEILRFKKAAD